jgi:hypothetical protein
VAQVFNLCGVSDRLKTCPTESLAGLSDRSENQLVGPFGMSPCWELTVPTSESASSTEEDDLYRLSEDVAAEPIAAAPQPKPRKKEGKAASPYEGMSLEQRIAARSEEAEASRSRLAEIFTGDIRPVLVGGGSILLGNFFIVFAFLMPGWLAAEFGRERTMDDVVSTTRNTRVGYSVLGGIYNTFGHTGLTIFMVVAGLAIIAGGVWFFRNYQGEED